MLDGVLWVLCPGAAWRDMLDRFGPWSTVYQRFWGWRNQGTFDQMLNRLLRDRQCQWLHLHAFVRSGSCGTGTKW